LLFNQVTNNGLPHGRCTLTDRKGWQHQIREHDLWGKPTLDAITSLI
jgi:hypothetical protein